jgi:hypothetical protein
VLSMSSRAKKEKMDRGWVHQPDKHPTRKEGPLETPNTNAAEAHTQYMSSKKKNQKHERKVLVCTTTRTYSLHRVNTAIL